MAVSYPFTFRRVLLIAVVNLSVTLVLLGGAELVCRHAEQASIDRKLPAQLRTLSAKTPSELRVFAFGGSTVFGVPVPEVGFVAQMQYWLQRLYPDRNIRVYNYGWWAENTGYVLRQFTHRLEAQPDLVIVITGHNEFLGSPPSGGLDSIQQTLRSRFATVRLLRQGSSLIKKTPPSFVMPCEVVPWDRKAAYFKGKMAEFEASLQAIVRQASKAGVPLIVGTLAANLSDWPPVYKRLAGRERRYQETVTAIQQLLRGGKYQDASAAVNAAATSYPEDAMLYFLRARIQSATGAYAEARESFVKARDLDPVPYRATSEINSIIRRLSSGVTGVHLVDLERVYEERATNGLVGFDLIADNVHGTPFGESITAQAIIQTMSEIGFLPPSRKLQDECCPVDTFLADVGYLEPTSPLRLRAALSNAKYSMKTPFLNFDASRMYLLEALKMDENAWAIWANLATLSYLIGDNATAAKELQRAQQLHPTPFDLDDRGTTPYLKEALEFSAGGGNCGAPY
jgi:tetratricopeptide (TPR) repeat protein